MISLRNRYIFYVSICLIFIFSSVYFRREIPELSQAVTEKFHDTVSPPPPPPPEPTKHTLIYKPQPTAVALPIVDNFPLAAAAHSAKELPPIPVWNKPPEKHVPENTPLFIGFTRNWRILQQVVVSYITAGWPPGDIYVVENTGVMDSNEQGRLSLQNPFFLNHTRLHMLGVNVLITPTLFTFAQLQNFYLWHSISSKWDHYYWSHMDVAALAFEDQYFTAHEKAGTPILQPSDPKHDYSDFPSLYKNCLKALRDVTAPDPETGKVIRWAMRFFSYDRLALVNVASFVEVGGWDTLIPFYATDCDMHARLEMANFNIEEKPGGMIFDVASSVDDLIVYYRKKDTPEATFTDPNIIEKELREAAEAAAAAEAEKNESKSIDSRSESTSENGGEAWYDFGLGSKTTTKWVEDEIFSDSAKKLIQTLDAMQNSKASAPRGRNTWQARQNGGEGDPFYRDSAGFEQGIWMTIEHGRNVFAEKWGHRGCDIVKMGLRPEDAWRVEHDW